MKTEQITEKAKEKAGQYAHDTELRNGFDMHPKTASFHGYLKGYRTCDQEWQEKLRWIPVEERLPEYVDKVLHIIAKNRVEELTESGFFKFCAFDLKANTNLSDFKKYFTHWREIIE